MGINKADNSSDEFYSNRNMSRYYPESFIEPVTRVGKNSITEQRKIHGRKKKSTEGTFGAERKRTKRKSQNQANTSNKTLNKTTKPKLI